MCMFEPDYKSLIVALSTRQCFAIGEATVIMIMIIIITATIPVVVAPGRFDRVSK